MNYKNKKVRLLIHGESFSDRIMMNDDENISIATRKKDGIIEEIVRKKESFVKKHPSSNFFIMRGIIKFFEGSANQFYAGKKTNKNNIKKNDKVVAYLFSSITILVGMLIYFICPTIMMFFLKNTIHNSIILGMIEGLTKLIIFFTVFFLIVIFGKKGGTTYYHGAEHKVLWCYRKGDDLTLENTKKYSTLYPACGTGLIFYMIIFSIPLFLLFGYENIVLRLLLILIGLPILIGISFEISLWTEGENSKISKVFSSPVLFLQKYNTKEPKKEHLEIALIAIKNLIKCKNKVN